MKCDSCGALPHASPWIKLRPHDTSAAIITYSNTADRRKRGELVLSNRPTPPTPEPPPPPQDTANPPFASMLISRPRRDGACHRKIDELSHGLKSSGWSHTFICCHPFTHFLLIDPFLSETLLSHSNCWSKSEYLEFHCVFNVFVNENIVTVQLCTEYHVMCCSST